MGRQQSATALMLLECRQAFNAERSPDVAMLRRLLADFGADANGVPDDLDEALQEHAMAHGDEQDSQRTPIMQLCTNTYCSPDSISSIVALLMEFGADLEKFDEDEDASLCFALINYNAAACEVLLSSGAQLHLSQLDALQNWVHPGHLRQLAPVFTARLRSRLRVKPVPDDSTHGWLRMQFGLWEESDADNLGALVAQKNEEGEVDELVEAWLRGHLCSCGGGQQFVEDVLCNILGREGYTERKRAALNELLRSEVEGSLSGHWEVDVEFVRLLLEMGANPNMLVTYNTDDDEENDSDSDDDSVNSNDDSSGHDESAPSEGDSESSPSEGESSGSND